METKSYNPKTVSTTDTYVVNTTGDRLFIPAYPIDGTMAEQLSQTKKLSPTGVENVAT